VRGDPAPLAPQTPLEPPRAPPTNLRRKKEERGGGRRKKRRRRAPLKLNPASATVFTNNKNCLQSLVHSHTGTYRSTKPKDCTWYLTLSLINYQKCEMCDISSMRLTTPVDRCPRKIHLLLTRKQVICKVLTATLSQTWTHISDNWLNWSKEWFRQSIFQFTQQGIEYQNSGEHILMHPSHISENFVVHLSCNVCSFTRNTSLTSTNGSIWV